MNNLVKNLTMFVLALVLLAGVVMVSPASVKAGTLVGVNNLQQTSSSTTSFKVEWDKDINAEGYQFQYSADKNVWSDIGKTKSLNYTVSGLNSGRSYYVQMRSANYDGYWNNTNKNPEYSGWTSVFEVVTAPSAVSGLVQSNGDSSSITVSWDESDGATGYDVYYEEGGTKFLSGSTKKNKFKIDNLNPDKYYKIHVYAYRESASGYKALSGDAYHSCYTTAGKIKKLELDKWDTENNIVRIVWKDNESQNTGYEVNVANLSGKTIFVDATSSTSMNLEIDSIQNKGCLVKVRAYRDIDGTEIYGKWSDTKVLIAPPHVVLQKVGEKSIKLKWDKVSGAESYTIYRSTSSYTGFKKVKTTTKTTLTNSGLKANTRYYYYVVANKVKAGGKTYNTTKPTYREISYLSGERHYYTYDKVN